MNPTISVITPTIDGPKELSVLINDFKNQTFKNFEHIIIYDGQPPQDVSKYMANMPSWVKFGYVIKDKLSHSNAKGTRARNEGLKRATGTFVCFADCGFDRYKDTYLEALLSGAAEDAISVVQIGAFENRLFKNGDPTKFRLIPEIGIYEFPVRCHIDTINCLFPKKLIECWSDEQDHDYVFIKKICDKYHPRINFKGGLYASKDGAFVGNIKDWVSIPPFYRDNTI